MSRESAVRVYFTIKMGCDDQSDSLSPSDIFYNNLAFWWWLGGWGGGYGVCYMGVK